MKFPLKVQTYDDENPKKQIKSKTTKKSKKIKGE